MRVIMGRFANGSVTPDETERVPLSHDYRVISPPPGLADDVCYCGSFLDGDYNRHVFALPRLTPGVLTTWVVWTLDEGAAPSWRSDTALDSEWKPGLAGLDDGAPALLVRAAHQLGIKWRE